MADRVEIALDAGSRIPDPPLAEEDILQWARDLTEKLRNDHSDTVGRVEHLIMSDKRTTRRPDATGTNRIFYDEYEEIMYLDSLDGDGNAKWKPINAFDNWTSEGLGVHVLYSTSLPVAGLTSGYFTWDEEAWDEDSYWPGSGSTLTMPETRAEDKAYQVEVFAEITALSSGSEIIISAIVDGNDLTFLPEAHTVWRSDGLTHKLRLNFIRSMVIGEELQIGYSADSTFTLNEQYVIVTPVTKEVGGGGVIPTVSDHGELSGLADDDHDTGSNAYIRVADSDSRATFANYWTDLTDGGSTTLHYHEGDVYLGNTDSIYWRNYANTDWIEVFNMSTGDDLIIGDSDAYGAVNDINMYAQDDMLFSAGDDVLFNIGGDVIYSITGKLNINTGGNIEFQDDLDMQAADIYLDNDRSVFGLYSGTYYSMIEMSSTGEITIGGGARNILLDTSGYIKIAYGAALRLVNSIGNGQDTLVASGDNFTLGASTWTDITITCANDLSLTPAGDLLLNPTGDVIVSDGLYANGGFDVSGSSKQIRLAYLGAAPSSLANGDIWMESDGLHIYYGGAEYTVAGV